MSKNNRLEQCVCGYECFVSDDGYCHCPHCGFYFRSKTFEIKVVGKVADEVKEVSKHLLKQASEYSNNNTITEKLMQLFNKKIKCKSFYNLQNRTVDLKGLQAGLSEKINIALATFKVDTKYQEASERLKTLDLLQYSISNDINGISDQNQRDILLKKVIETKSQMIGIIIELIGKENTAN